MSATRIVSAARRATLTDVTQPWLLAVLFALALAALGMLIRAVLRMLRAARLCDVPLAERQEIEFPAAGRVVLCMEGPRFTPQFRRLEYELRLPGGASVAGHRVILRTVTSGITKARVTLRTYDLPYPGRYLLEIRGLEPKDVGAPEHRIVFMRPHLVRSLLLVVGITIASALVIVSLVFLLLAVLPTAGAIDPGRAEGYVEVDGERIELRQALAHLHRNREGRLPFTPELRIVLADREVPQESLAGLEALPILELARAGKVRGLLIRLDPGEPGTLSVTRLVPPRAGERTLVTRQYEATGTDVIRQLSLSSQRVGGDIVCPAVADLQCSAHFSAPVFHE
jgi:hypothetical protein